LAGIGFQELVLLFVIGLLILGPERLPRVASQIGRWVGRARRTANQLRYQLEREIALADIEKTAKAKKQEPGSAKSKDKAKEGESASTETASSPADAGPPPSGTDANTGAETQSPEQTPPGKGPAAPASPARDKTEQA
jgi:sec-independent protein translocase protein TatB